MMEKSRRDVLWNPEARGLFSELMLQVMPSPKDAHAAQAEAASVMLTGFPVKRIIVMTGILGGTALNKEQIIALNRQ